SLVLRAPLVLPEHAGRRIQVVIETREDGSEARLYGQALHGESAWQLHASADVRGVGFESPAPRGMPALRARCAQGASLGGAPPAVRAIYLGAGEALADLAWRPESEGGGNEGEYGLHPGLLGTTIWIVYRLAGAAGTMPFAIERLAVYVRN